jgi:hypothetical protein
MKDTHIADRSLVMLDHRIGEFAEFLGSDRALFGVVPARHLFDVCP